MTLHDIKRVDKKYKFDLQNPPHTNWRRLDVFNNCNSGIVNGLTQWLAMISPQ